MTESPDARPPGMSRSLRGALLAAMAALLAAVLVMRAQNAALEKELSTRGTAAGEQAQSAQASGGVP